MSKFIVGEDYKVQYENKAGETLSLEGDKMYTITAQGNFEGFEGDELIFELEGQEVYIPVSMIKNIE